MTQLEKIELLKNTIQFLYEKEGRSINYISKILEIDRKTLSIYIKKQGFIQGEKRHLTPSTQKFLNKNKTYIIKRLKEQADITQIAKELGITRDKLYYLINCSEELKNIKLEWESRKINQKVQKALDIYCFEDIPGEEWKEILGYTGYYVSNMGRFKKFLTSYNCYQLLTLSPNIRTGRLYISLINDNNERKNLIAARIVAFNFCEGYSNENNTVDYIDGDFTNNKASNLQWVSQSENNQRSYDKKLRTSHKGYSKNGKFKEVRINKKYSFKTIAAAARFLGCSESQIQRYLDGECKFNGIIELIY